jgi:hypothetical protein
MTTESPVTGEGKAPRETEPNTAGARTHLEGYEPNQAGLEAFNSIHNRKAFRLYADKHANWYVIYMPVHGIHASYGFGSEANRLVRSAITGKQYRIA